MRKYLCALMTLVIVLPALAAAPATPTPRPAPTTRPAAAMPAAEDVLTRVPAEALGVLVVRNVSQTGATVDKFIRDIGLGEMVQDSVLSMIKEAMLIENGFNENGGLAVVVLDPAKYGWDIPKLLTDESNETPAVPPPVAVLVPGNEPMKLLANHKPQQENNYVRIAIDGEDMYAKAIGGYTVLAPSTALVDGVIASTKAVTTKIPKAHQDMMAKLDLAVFVDMKMLAPIVSAGLDRVNQEFEKMSAQMAQYRGPDPGQVMVQGMLQFYTPLLKDQFNQLDADTFGLRIGLTGVVIENLASYKADSDMGKILATTSAPAGPLMDKLPALPYILAMGAKVATPSDPAMAAKARQMSQDIIAKLMDSSFMSKVPQASRDRLRTAVTALEEQIVAQQMYIGGSVPGSGMFGLSVVMTVKDAETTRRAIADAIPAYMDMVGGLIGDDGPKFTVTYTPAAAKVGELSADTIVITAAEMEQMDENERAEMTKVVGENRLAFYVLQPDPKTVVLTFGGGVSFAAQAVKAVQTPTVLDKDPEVAKALAEMPKNPSCVILFNPANLLEVIKSGAREMMGAEAASSHWMMKMTLETKTPVAVGASTGPDGLRMAVYVPTSLIGETVRRVQEVMAIMMGGMMQGGFEGAEPVLVAPDGDF